MSKIATSVRLTNDHLAQVRRLGAEIRRLVRRGGPGSGDHLGAEFRAAMGRARMAGATVDQVRAAAFGR